MCAIILFIIILLLLLYFWPGFFSKEALQETSPFARPSGRPVENYVSPHGFAINGNPLLRNDNHTVTLNPPTKSSMMANNRFTGRSFGDTILGS